MDRDIGNVKVAGTWELSWNTPIKEYDLWRFPMRDFGVKEWCMSPISGINKNGITETNTVHDFISNNPDYTVVHVDENGDIDLEDFEHPQDALYVLGKAGGSPKDNSQLSVKIRTKEGKGLLWPHQAICIILYDRLLKWQSQ